MSSSRTPAGRRRYGDPRKTGRPGDGRRGARWLILSPGTLAGAGFCLLAAAGLVVASVTSYRRHDSEFGTAAGMLLVAVMCAFLLSIALAILSPRLEGRALLSWELTVITLLLGLGVAFLLLTDDFATDRSMGVRTPTSPSGGRITGVILLAMGLLRAGMLRRRRS